MKRAAICILLLIFLGSACGDDAVEPQPTPEPPASDFDAQVWENAGTVAAAADSFHLVNGRYPVEVAELAPFLPDDTLLVNPATGQATEPVMPDGVSVLLDPPLRGSVGIRIFRRYEGNMTDVGYYIVARGEHCDSVITNVPDAELALDRDGAVVSNCKLVAEAAFAFARENGYVFPSGLADVNNAGRTLVDYFPDGRLLTNPYTGLNTEPVGGAAASPGQTGYLADGSGNGYAIGGVGSVVDFELVRLTYPPAPDAIPPPEVTVVGCPQMRDPLPASHFDLVVNENCSAVAAAAEAFFDEHGEYAGSYLALLQYLPGAWWLLNPASLVRSEPSGSTPEYPGEIGYRRITEYGVGVVGYYVTGLDENEELVARTNIPDVDRILALELAVAEVCRVVEVAADAFADDNLGRYPAGRYDVSLAGRYFQEYLPGGTLLPNVYTGERTEPQFSIGPATPPGLPGEIDYVSFDNNRDGRIERYLVLGIGSRERAVVYSADHWSQPKPDTRNEDQIMGDNCNVIAGAARAHSADRGVWPRDVAMLQPWLPAGRLLFNPVSGRLSEPSGAIPDLPGSIGYRLIWEYLSHPVGFYVQGRGTLRVHEVTNIPDVERHLALEAAVIVNCVTAADAAEAFARENAGVFPADDTDVNLAGKRVVDYLPGGVVLENPYTHEASVPEWSGEAVGAGQTGYAAWHADADGTPDGYTVNGVGAGSGVTIFVLLDPERRWQPPLTQTRTMGYAGQ